MAKLKLAESGERHFFSMAGLIRRNVGGAVRFTGMWHASTNGMKPMLVLWMFIALFLVALIGMGVRAHFPKPSLNVSPDAGREIQKAMHK